MKLPKFLYDDIKVHKTSLGDNEAFPPEEDVPFDYKVIKKRFNDVCDVLMSLNIDFSDEVGLQARFSKSLKRCKEIERPFRDKLVKVCENFVNNSLGVPESTVIFKCELVDDIKPNKMYRLMPEDVTDRGFDFDNLTDFSNSSKSVMKRRLINSLIQGASYDCDKYGAKELRKELDSIHPQLYDLYNEISAINDYMLFIKKDDITDEKPNQGAYVEVLIGHNGEKAEINVQGLIFPYLLSESFRGFFELFASHGLPNDISKANYIIRQADFLLAEPWDIRFGVGLWEILSEGIDNSRIIPYFFTTLCEMDADSFNENLKEIFANTKRGKEIRMSLIDESKKMCDMNSLIGTIKMKNNDVSVLNDSYISTDELDDYVIEEDDVEENDNINDIDYEQLIESCTTNDIDFNGVQINDIQFQMLIYVNGIEIPTNIVDFKAEPREINGKTCYQVHTFINQQYQHKGFGYKIHKRFVELYGNVYCGHGRRLNDNEVLSIFRKLNNEPNIKVVNVRNVNGISLGIKAILLDV